MSGVTTPTPTGTPTTTTTGMAIVQSVGDLRDAVRTARRDGASVAFVPTMGALHRGHERLMEVARSSCDLVVASSYVNPLQFGAGEDLDRYPRTPEHDIDACRRCGVDLLWRPSDRDIYGDDPRSSTQVRVGAIGDVLEGASRPGHFDGVATVVVRLLSAVGPDVLLLGRKDYQQVAVLRRVVADLLLPVQVDAVDTVREPDGLAMSSRNAYLAPNERRAAVAIPRALDAARAAAAAGEVEVARIVAAARGVLDAAPLVAADYLELVHDGTVDRCDSIGSRGATLLVAAHVGSTRLIDNAYLPAPTSQREARP